MDGELELLGERLAEQAAHLDAATHRLLADLRQFDERGGWHRQGAQSCAHWLSWRLGWDPVTARDKVRVARKLGEFSATDDALRRGELSYSKVRAILRVATPANEAMLLELARLSTAAQLERLSRKYARVQAHGKDVRPRDDEQRRYVRRRDTDDGMVKIEAVLHSEEAELVWAMLDHAAKQLVRERPPRPRRGDPPESTATADLTAPSAAKPDDAHSFADSAEARLATCAQADPGSTRLTGSQVANTACAAGDSAEAGSLQHPPADPNGTRSSMHTAADTLGEAGDPAEARTGGFGPSTPGSARPAGTASPVALVPVSARPPSGLRQVVDAEKRAFSRADALIAVVQAYLRGDRPERAPVDVTITIPVSDLRDGVADPAAVGCMGTSCIAAETARRLCCDAGVVEVVEDEHGVPLSVGRKRRTIAGSIKRALLKRDDACVYPGCENRIFLEGHHIRHWADGGETSLSNACLVCTHHHRFVHEYGYHIELGVDGRPLFRDPRGQIVAVVPAQPTELDVGWSRILEANAALDIDAETIACEWDGTQMSYGTVIDQLVSVDGLT